MTENEEIKTNDESIIDNYKYYMNKILKYLKKNEEIRATSGKYCSVKFLLNKNMTEEQNKKEQEKVIKNPLQMEYILFDKADLNEDKNYQMNLRYCLENIAYALLEANVVGFKEKDKDESSKSKETYDEAKHATKIIEKILYFNPHCMPERIEKYETKIILPKYPFSDGCYRPIFKFKFCNNNDKNDFYTFKNFYSYLSDKSHEKRRQFEESKSDNLGILKIENYIRKLLKSHLCKIIKISKEDHDECALNKKRKTNIILTNCIRCELDFDNYQIKECKMCCF